MVKWTFWTRSTYTARAPSNRFCKTWVWNVKNLKTDRRQTVKCKEEVTNKELRGVPLICKWFFLVTISVILKWKTNRTTIRLRRKICDWQLKTENGRFPFFVTTAINVIIKATVGEMGGGGEGGAEARQMTKRSPQRWSRTLSTPDFRFLDKARHEGPENSERT